MDDGKSPDVAVASAILRLLKAYPGASALLIAGSAQGQFSKYTIMQSVNLA